MIKFYTALQIPRLSSTPSSSPDSESTALYTKTDGGLYLKDPSGNETGLGGQPDSGWITVGSGGTAPAYTSGYSDASTSNDYRTRFRSVGGVCYLIIAVVRATTASPIFTLPVGYRPSVPVFSPGAAYSGAAQTNQGVYILTNGAVNFNTSSLASGTYYASMSFPIG